MRPRIRTFKPEVLLDEDLWDLEIATGLPIFRGFLGLWSYADREGRFEWRPRILGPGILPHWEGDFSRVLDALATRGFVVRYTVDGREYGHVRTFTKHQVINNREEASKIPPPPEHPTTAYTSTREARVDDASCTREARGLSLAQAERNGTERNGTEPRVRDATPQGNLEQTRTAFIVRLREAYESRGAIFGVGKTLSQVTDLAAALLPAARARGVEPLALLESMLPAWFADERARNAGYPVGWLASSPSQYDPALKRSASGVFPAATPKAAAIRAEMAKLREDLNQARIKQDHAAERILDAKLIELSRSLSHADKPNGASA